MCWSKHYRRISVNFPQTKVKSRISDTRITRRAKSSPVAIVFRYLVPVERGNKCCIDQWRKQRPALRTPARRTRPLPAWRAPKLIYEAICYKCVYWAYPKNTGFKVHDACWEIMHYYHFLIWFRATNCYGVAVCATRIWIVFYAIINSVMGSKIDWL